MTTFAIENSGCIFFVSSQLYNRICNWIPVAKIFFPSSYFNNRVCNCFFWLQKFRHKISCNTVVNNLQWQICCILVNEKPLQIFYLNDCIPIAIWLQFYNRKWGANLRFKNSFFTSNTCNLTALDSRCKTNFKRF